MSAFTTIGHIVNDIEPFDHLGGGVSYASIAAAKLGYKASIITRCPPDHPYIEQLKALGVTVHVLPVRNNTITSFSNLYNAQGHRTQRVTEQQDPITHADFNTLQPFIKKDGIILIAPVIAEVDMQLFPLLAPLGTLAVTPQGYFRKREADGKVTQIRWEGFEKYLKYCHITIFSDEDITINGKLDLELLEAVKTACRTVVLTRGANGATIYQDGKTIETPAFHLEKKALVDFTGAGDIFATAFISEYTKSGDIRSAAASAHHYAAVKIMAESGIGIDSIPAHL